MPEEEQLSGDASKGEEELRSSSAGSACVAGRFSQALKSSTMKELEVIR